MLNARMSKVEHAEKVLQETESKLKAEREVVQKEERHRALQEASFPSKITAIAFAATALCNARGTTARAGTD